MATLRLFAQAREAAGTSRDDLTGRTVEDVLATACSKYGEDFARVLEISRIWLNGNPAEGSEAVADDDEVAVLPPVSGGSGSA